MNPFMRLLQNPFSNPTDESPEHEKWRRAVKAAEKKNPSTDPSLWTIRRAFGVAGGPDEVVLTEKGSALAFSVGAQVKQGAPSRALEKLAAMGGSAALTVKRGARHGLTDLGRQFDQVTWGYLRSKGYVESFYSEGEDGVRLTAAGERAVERGHEERFYLLERARKEAR